ncbi:MAG: hypothetical protein M3083_16155 [Actinomycetota bacterium]|nr:hypothetical protein [Actinomycetota bacterium]
MAQKPVAQRVPNYKEGRLALYPDLPFEEAVATLLAVDPRKTGAEEEGDNERRS